MAEILLGNAFVTDKGAWAQGTSYETNDIVHSDSGVYMSLVDGNTTSPEAGDVTKWRQWVDLQAITDELTAHAQKVGDNGNWWKWDVATQAYVDTNVAARGGIFYPSFSTVGNVLYIEDNNSQVADRLVLEGNELQIIV